MKNKLVLVDQLKDILVAQRKLVKGFSQNEMASRLNISEVDYSKLEADIGKASFAQVLKITNILELSLYTVAESSEFLEHNRKFSPNLFNKIGSQNTDWERKVYGTKPPLDFNRRSAKKW